MSLMDVGLSSYVNAKRGMRSRPFFLGIPTGGT
jgi:hypothetical protein